MKKNKVKNGISQIHLTREEVLEVENLELRIGIANQEIQRLLGEKSAVAMKIQARTGVSIEGWTIDLKAGTARKPGPPPAPPSPPNGRPQ